MRHARTLAVIGEKRMRMIRGQTVMVCGLGGVGGTACEALARFGVGRLIVVDCDFVQESDINRQAVARYSTIGLAKVAVMESMIRDLDPEIVVVSRHERINAATIPDLLALSPDVVVDCIDDVTAKTELIIACQHGGLPIVSAMGFANKLHPELIKIGRLGETSVCPLAKTIRKRIRDSGGSLDLRVVYSQEIPIETTDSELSLGSVSFVPAAAGLTMAAVVINEFLPQEGCN